MELKLAAPLPVPTPLGGSACSTPYYTSAPSSPPEPFNHFPFYYSAPSSPRSSSSSSVPFHWEDQPGISKFKSSNHQEHDHGNADDFEFFSGHLEFSRNQSLTAEELFDGGVIRPLKPPPRLQQPTIPKSAELVTDSPKSPRSPISKLRQTLSPKSRTNKRDGFDPFEAALESARLGAPVAHRGRTGKVAVTANSQARKGSSRSLSPLRVSEFAELTSNDRPPARKWRLRDLLLFRSASEGSARTSRHPLKYFGGDAVAVKKKRSELSSEKVSVDGGLEGSRRRSEQQMKNMKTPLQYKNVGVLGCLGFNFSSSETARLHELSKRDWFS